MKNANVGLFCAIFGGLIAAFGMPEPAQAQSSDSAGPIILKNAGRQDLEGHTPTTFQGQGVGLFIGDNLNAGFPAGAGLQMFLHFDLSKLPAGIRINTAVLSSKFAHIRSRPLNSLGSILVDNVTYPRFSSGLWNTPRGAAACVLTRRTNGEFGCDLAPSLSRALSQGKKTLALRLRFEHNSDNDGRLDLLSFYSTRPNENVPGIFMIAVTPKP